MLAIFWTAYVPFVIGRSLSDLLLHNAQGEQVICAAAIYGKQNAADICGS